MTVSALGDAAVLDAAVTVAQVGALAIFLVRSTALQEVAMTTPGQTYGMDALTGFFGVRLPPLSHLLFSQAPLTLGQAINARPSVDQEEGAAKEEIVQQTEGAAQ